LEAKEHVVITKTRKKQISSRFTDQRITTLSNVGKVRMKRLGRHTVGTLGYSKPVCVVMLPF
jgi:hypothetical protein